LFAFFVKSSFYSPFKEPWLWDLKLCFEGHGSHVSGKIKDEGLAFRAIPRVNPSCHPSCPSPLPKGPKEGVEISLGCYDHEAWLFFAALEVILAIITG